jgi:hypothetical protein
LAVDDNLDQVDLAASEYYSEGHLYRKDGLPIKIRCGHVVRDFESEAKTR